MTLTEKQADIVGRFDAIESWEDRYREIIQLGKSLEPFPEDQRTDANQVRGCQSRVWMHAALGADGTMTVLADSDAAIVRGLIAVVLGVYSGETPDDILSTPPDFVDRLGLSTHLSQNRANGLSAMIKQIKLYAVAFRALAAQRDAAQ